MGCTPSRLEDPSEKAVRRREEIMTQARRQRARDSNKSKREEWIRHKSQRRMDKLHTADGIPEGWGIPDLGYADNRDGPYEQYPWSV